MTISVPAADVDAGAALLGGRPVVVPNPPPLTHVVTATDPRAVNIAKGRPADQPVAVWITTDDQWSELAATLLLADRAIELARRLLIEELVTLLMPVEHGDRPCWLRPATHRGHALMFGARWQPLCDLLPETDVRYVSSANRTGSPPAASAAQARAMFDSVVPVVEVSGPAHEPEMPRRATTTLRVERDGHLVLTREGAQDHAHGGSHRYLDHLRDRYADLFEPR